MNDNAKTHLDKAISIVEDFCNPIPIAYLNSVRLFCNNDDTKVEAFVKEGGFVYQNTIKAAREQSEFEFYYHINKSLLNAEYLIIEEYSKKIERLVKSIEKNETLSNEKKPRFIKDFIILASKLKDLCWRIRNGIGEDNNRRIAIDNHSEEVANNITRSLNIDDLPTANSDSLLLFTYSVIEMTVIDHIYKATSENIEKLLILWKRIDIIANIETNDFPTIATMVKAKTATMLYKMVIEIGDKGSRELLELNNVKFFYSIGVENDKDLEIQIKGSRMKSGLNPVIVIKNEKKDKEINETDIYGDENNKKIKRINFSSYYYKDIISYNNWIENGQKHYCGMSSIISKISNKNNDSLSNKDIETLINEIELFEKNKSINHYSPYFFLLILSFIQKQIDRIEYYKDIEKLDLKIKLLKLLKTILHLLNEYVQTYENRMPSVFRPYFEHSFYLFSGINDVSNKKEFIYFDIINSGNSFNTYDCNEFKNAFFFASYYCNPISINRLKEKYEMYTLYFDSYSSTFAQTLNIKEIELEENIKKQEEDIKKNQHHSLQILGLFTAFLSFIVTSIGTFRVARNLSEYIIYSLTYTLAIALFAFLITDNDNHKDNKDSIQDNDKKQKWKSISFIIKSLWLFVRKYKKQIAFIITLIGLIYFSKLYFFNK